MEGRSSCGVLKAVNVFNPLWDMKTQCPAFRYKINEYSYVLGLIRKTLLSMHINDPVIQNQTRVDTHFPMTKFLHTGMVSWTDYRNS